MSATQRKIKPGDLISLKPDWAKQREKVIQRKKAKTLHPYQLISSFSHSHIILIPYKVFSETMHTNKSFFLNMNSRKIVQEQNVYPVIKEKPILLYLGYEKLYPEPHPGDDNKLHCFLCREQKMFTLLMKHATLDDYFQIVHT